MGHAPAVPRVDVERVASHADAFVGAAQIVQPLERQTFPAGQMGHRHERGRENPDSRFGSHGSKGTRFTRFRQSARQLRGLIV